MLDFFRMLSGTFKQKFLKSWIYIYIYTHRTTVYISVNKQKGSFIQSSDKNILSIEMK